MESQKSLQWLLKYSSVSMRTRFLIQIPSLLRVPPAENTTQFELCLEWMSSVKKIHKSCQIARLNCRAWSHETDQVFMVSYRNLQEKAHAETTWSTAKSIPNLSVLKKKKSKSFKVRRVRQSVLKLWQSFRRRLKHAETYKKTVRSYKLNTLLIEHVESQFKVESKWTHTSWMERLSKPQLLHGKSFWKRYISHFGKEKSRLFSICWW